MAHGTVSAPMAFGRRLGFRWVLKGSFLGDKVRAQGAVLLWVPISHQVPMRARDYRRTLLQNADHRPAQHTLNYNQTKSSSPRSTTFGSDPSVGAAACGHACGITSSLPRRGATCASVARAPRASPPASASRASPGSASSSSVSPG